MIEQPTPECFAQFPSVTPIDVAWGDMDAFGHVNNTKYFRYFETARIAYFTVIEVLDQRVGPIMASTSCRFRAPVTFPDRLLVGARLLEFQGDRFAMEHLVWSTALQTIAAKGDSVIVPYDYETKSKVPIPDLWRQAIERVESRVR
jgi:acyl-CoA thioester hydrolase